MLINVWVAMPASIVADRKLDLADEIARDRAPEVAPVTPPKGGKNSPAPGEGRDKPPRVSKPLADALRKIDEAHTPEFKTRTDRGVLRVLQDLYFPEETAEDSIAELIKGGAVFLGDWRWDGSRFSDRPLDPDLILYMPARTAPPAREGEVGAPLPARLEDVGFLWGQQPRAFI